MTQARETLTVEGSGDPRVRRQESPLPPACPPTTRSSREPPPKWRSARRTSTLVIGSDGKGILERLPVGSVKQSVLHRITRPLLVVWCPPKAS